ncbi:TMTC2-like protein [Mya arenaria]|uniref:dolichyl-phosphate-mannose--protein mannosyltransferase n=1 Tax=Mya arenaria TaxID=6604 RepID=A0ABY7FLD6_MYAAR|nr:TMTC2-like protein [Mya arenaria]
MAMNNEFYKVEWRRTMEGVILLVVVLVTLVAARVYFMGNTPPEFAPSDNPASDADSFTTRTLTYALLPALNMWILLCPNVLSFDWSMSSIPLVESISDFRNTFSFLFYSFLFYFAYLTLSYIHSQVNEKTMLNGNSHSSHVINSSRHSSLKHKSFHTERQTSVPGDTTVSYSKSHFTVFTVSSHTINVIIFSAALMVLPFIPATNLFFYVRFVIAERVLYIPSMGFCLLVAHGLHTIYNHFHSNMLKQKLLAIATVFLILMYSGKTVRRNVDWRTEEMLYTSGIAVNPPKAWGNLANIFNNQGRVDDAETAYRNALKYRPNMSDTHYNLPNLSMAHLNLGILLAQLGDGKQAEQESISVFEEALRRRPDHYAPQSLYNLYGETFSSLGNHEEAERYYRKALAAKPDHIPAHLTMAKLMHKLGRLDDAESWFAKARTVDPSDSSVQQHYALYLGETGRLTESAAVYRKVLERDPDNFEMVFNAANILRQIDKSSEAEKLFHRATQLRRNDATAHMNLGAMYHINGKLSEAERSYTRALELKPGDKVTQDNLVKLRNLRKSQQKT